MNTSLTDALSYTYEICGRSLSEACKHAIILMAQSARAMTPQARKNRKIHRDNYGRYVERYKKTVGVWKDYSWMHDSTGFRVKGTFEEARIIKGRGLAKRSWMWGLRGLNKVIVEKKPILGVGELRKILTDTVGGFILTNKLNYLLKILPAGWEQAVQQKAVNKIMKQAQMRLEREWARDVKQARRFGVAVGAQLGKYLLRV